MVLHIYIYIYIYNNYMNVNLTRYVKSRMIFCFPRDKLVSCYNLLHILCMNCARTLIVSWLKLFPKLVLEIGKGTSYLTGVIGCMIICYIYI